MSQQPFNSDYGFSTTGNVVAENLLILGTISPSAVASPAPSLSGFDSVSAITLSASGNVTGAYVKGNGSELTNLPAPAVTYDNTSSGYMDIMTYDGNIKYVSQATIEPASGNIKTVGNISAMGNITAENILVVGSISASGVASPAPSLNGFDTINAIHFSASGNITGHQLSLNANTGNVLTAVERITADVFAQPPQNPGVMLQTSGQAGVPARVYFDGVGAYAAYIGRRYNGTPQAPTQALAGNILARFGATPYTGNGWPGLSTTRIDMIATEDQTATAQGSKITMSVTTPGSNVLANIVTVLSSGVSVVGGIGATGNISADNVFASGVSVVGNISANNMTLSSNLDGNLSSVLNISADGAYQPVNSAGVMLQVTGQTGVPTRFTLDAANSYVTYVNRVYGGTPTAPTGVAANTLITRFGANPYTSTGWVSNSTARIDMWTTETQTTTARGSQIVFATIPNGSNVIANVATMSSNGLSVAGNVTVSDTVSAAGNVYVAGPVSAGGNVRGANINTAGNVTATGNVYGNYFVGNGSQLTGLNFPVISVNGYSGAVVLRVADISGAAPLASPIFTGNVTANYFVGNLAGTTVSTTGNITGNCFIGNGSQLTNIPTQATGSWTLSAGTNTVSFTVPAGQTYTMWVSGNIPNGIVVWNATATLTNTNVPVIGQQFGWYYSAGNALVLTSMPSQIIGTAGSISTASPAVANTNVFNFTIVNNSGSSQTVYYGWTQIS